MIPVNKPAISQESIESVTKTLNEGWVSSDAPVVKEFEKVFSAALGRKYCVSMSNGTIALIAAVKALNLPKSSTIIIPNFTIISCALAAVYNQLKVKTVDVHNDHLNANVEDLICAITPETSAILVPHIYGLSTDMEKLRIEAKKRKIVIIEDSAENHFGKINNKVAGTFGDVATYSFYANKHIVMGEGGCVVTDDDSIFRSLCHIRNLGFDNNNRFVHQTLENNYRLGAMSAALALPQISERYNIYQKKVEIGLKYHDRLRRRDDIQLMPEELPWTQNNFWVVPVRFKSSQLKNKVQTALTKKKIGTRPFFYPLDLQPALQDHLINSPNSKSNAKQAYDTGFYIPSFLDISDTQIDYVCKEILICLDESE